MFSIFDNSPASINLRKSRLIQTCEENKYKWFEDPSNQNENFERVKVRKIIASLSKNKKSKLYSEFKVNSDENKFFEIQLAKFFIENLEFKEYGKFTINKTGIISGFNRIPST